MKRIYLLFFLVIIIAVIVLLVYIFFQKPKSSLPQNNLPTVSTSEPRQKNNSPSVSNTEPAPQQTQPKNANVGDTGKGSASIFQPPLDRAGERVLKKKFGMYITPQNSPVQPERFQGYHTGVDFEIFPEELNAEVQVHAVCSGELKLKKYASGYGGVAVQACELDKDPITVVYGHLKLSGIAADVETNINVGEIIGILGANRSVETDGERKHLHLGFHKGTAIDIRGYVSSEAELANWIDPCLYVCHN
ncbi:MAG: M23 family metallopeptidase [Patescibacteria group bacterium]|nr:M23 family metallopeptidase [Patescibacteria group bacterium]